MNALADARIFGALVRSLNRFFVIVEAYKLRIGVRFGLRIVDAPSPHPTSATLAPFFNFSSTPASDGIHALIKFAA